MHIGTKWMCTLACLTVSLFMYPCPKWYLKTSDVFQSWSQLLQLYAVLMKLKRSFRLQYNDSKSAVNKTFPLLAMKQPTNSLKTKMWEVFFPPLKILKEKGKTDFLTWSLYILLFCHTSGDLCFFQKGLKEIKKRILLWGLLNIVFLSELSMSWKYKFIVIFIKRY